MGKETERTVSRTVNRGGQGSSSESIQSASRDLAAPEEIRVMKDTDCVVLLRSEYPVVDRKYNLAKHSNYRKIPQGGAKPYVLADDYMGEAVSITLAMIDEITQPELTDDVYEEIKQIESQELRKEHFYEKEEQYHFDPADPE